MPATTNKKKAWELLRKLGLKMETDALICAAQKQALVIATALAVLIVVAIAVGIAVVVSIATSIEGAE